MAQDLHSEEARWDIVLIALLSLLLAPAWAASTSYDQPASQVTVLSTGPAKESFTPVKLVRADGSAFYDASGSSGTATFPWYTYVVGGVPVFSTVAIPVSFSSGTPTTPLYVLFATSQSVNSAQLGSWFTSTSISQVYGRDLSTNSYGENPLPTRNFIDEQFQQKQVDLLEVIGQRLQMLIEILGKGSGN